MISRAHRFHGHGGVKAVYRQGAQVRGNLCSLKYVCGQGSRPYRLAVVVSRKVHKSAVVRNRIRRRIYEAVRTADVPPSVGSDLVITVYNDQIATMPAADLRSQIARLLQKTR